MSKKVGATTASKVTPVVAGKQQPKAP